MENHVIHFSDLEVWQEGRKLTKLVYERTRVFPHDEKFGLTSQMRRSSVSIIANIAEGFGRLSIKEKLNFYNLAHGSLTELQSHTIIATDLGYLISDQSSELLSKTNRVQTILQGLMRSTRKRLT